MTRHNDFQPSRRNLLIASIITPVIAGTTDGQAAADQGGLAKLNPLGDVSNYSGLKPLLFDSDRCKTLITQLFEAYQTTGDPRYAEWASVYGFPWWRTAATRADRIRCAKISQKIAGKLASDHPTLAAGHQWLAIHMGTEILSVGVVDALHAVPRLRKSLERAMAIDPRYFYGLPTLILAKVYSKLPQFPVSIGDLDHALALLEEIKPLQHDSFAVWHLFNAETLYLKGATPLALQALAAIDQAVAPKDPATAYLKDATLYDARILAKKIQADDYDRYLWDPLLEVPQAK